MVERNALYQKYGELENQRSKNEMMLHKEEDHLKSLESKVKIIEKEFRDQNEDEISKLESRISIKQGDIKKRKKELVIEPGEFDFDRAYKEYDAESEKLAKQQQEEIVAKRDSAQDNLKKKQKELQAHIKNEKAVVEKDQRLKDTIDCLHHSREKGKLPKVIASNLEDVKDEDLIQKYNIKDGDSIVKLGKNVDNPQRLSSYVPQWKKVAFVFLMAIVAAIFGMLIFSNSGFGNGIETASVAAANGIAVFFQRLLNALLRLLIGALIGAVVGLILFLIIKIVHLIWIGAVIGGLIGFVIGFRGSSVNYLEDSTQITVGMGGKIIVFAIVLVIIGFIFYAIDLHGYVVELTLFVPPLYKAAVNAQTALLVGNADSYHIVMNYAEILEIVCTNQISARVKELEASIKEFEEQIRNGSKELLEKRKQQRESVVDQERAAYDAQRQKIIGDNKKINQAIDEIQKEIAKAKEEIQRRKTDLEKLIAEKKKECEKEIQQTKNKIQNTSAEIKKEIDEIKSISANMKKKCIEDPVEILDEFYWWQPEDKALGYSPIMRILHKQKPVMFRYQTDENETGKDKIRPIYDAIKKMYYDLIQQNLDLCKVSVLDPYMNAVDLESIKDIEKYNASNSSRLYETMEKVVKWVARKGDTWNNACDAGEGMGYSEYPCQIVFVVIPPEDLQKIQLDDRLWELVRQGEDKGVIPIFFVSEVDYKTYSSEENKEKSKNMRELQSNVFSKKENMYTINLKNGFVQAI